MSGIRFEATPIAGLHEIHPDVFRDERGSFIKTFVAEEYAAEGLSSVFAEEYHTVSARGVVRGMHFQLPPHDHDKVVFCTEGAAMDVVLDLRTDSPTFGQTLTFLLEGPSGAGLYIPKGLAHGFCGMSETCTLAYRVTTPYSREHDGGVLWSSIGVEWPFAKPIVSARDAALPPLTEFESPFVCGGWSCGC